MLIDPSATSIIALVDVSTWSTRQAMKIDIDYFMVGESTRVLFTARGYKPDKWTNHEIIWLLYKYWDITTNSKQTAVKWLQTTNKSPNTIFSQIDSHIDEKDGETLILNSHLLQLPEKSESFL